MWWILFVVVGLYLMVLVGVSLLFIHPFRTPIFISPGYVGCKQEEFSIASEEGVHYKSKHTLHGWWSDLDHQESPKVVVVCAHGYMMNRAELSPLAFPLSQWGCASVFFDFRAHGKSGGKKSGFGLSEVSDLKAIVEAARARYPGAKVVCLGSSMGAAASSFFAAQYPELVDGLVLDSAYDRLSDAVDGWWFFIGGKFARLVLAPAVYVGIPLAGMNPKSVYVSKALSMVNKPTLILHGEADVLASPQAAKSNYDALKGPKEIVWFAGRNHSEARWEDSEKYLSHLESFLKSFFLS